MSNISEMKEQELTPDELIFEKQLPIPKGYKILIALPEIEDTHFGTGILKTDSEKRREYILSIMGIVIDMGDEAYTDKARFPNGAWCEIGDYVMFRMNSGTRFTVAGREYRLLNDDSIEATIPDPRGIMKV